MGLLAENKIRRKINKDPNNTKWTKDTNTFGQKILRAQGWQPGQFLGAQDAPHSELHTAANASYIRVVLKDDMKGLGFSKSKEDEITGLDVFQDLLSRLNGKTDDAIEEDQQTRLAVKTHHFVEQRYGAMKFVYGGLLVGDEMKEAEDKAQKQQTETNSDEDVVMESAPTPKESKKEKKSKKRKASDDDEEESSRETDSKSKKRRKEERKLKEADSDDAKAKKKKDKKDKKEKSRKKSTEEVSDDEDATPSEERSKKRKSKSKDKSRSPEESDEDKVKSKKEKKEKKDKKKRKKEEAASESTSTLVTQDSTPAVSAPGTGVTTPSGTSTPRGSRNFVRSRFIAQKRQAVLDTKALNQIFMVKA
ncbi:hypothetical protein FSARC_10980 [Fusarium sarcochroum]|uniref:PinX1-related protein 1 n=1 Tax=Fusarium sarcochroum TaxID=1208366 RepID=A0A8H4X1F5_9HYPO|nr:hypothetical protein FSARC_10980 [Fusarium sarcochroum]